MTMETAMMYANAMNGTEVVPVQQKLTPVEVQYVLDLAFRFSDERKTTPNEILQRYTKVYSYSWTPEQKELYLSIQSFLQKMEELYQDMGNPIYRKAKSMMIFLCGSLLHSIRVRFEQNLHWGYWDGKKEMEEFSSQLSGEKKVLLEPVLEVMRKHIPM